MIHKIFDLFVFSFIIKKKSIKNCQRIPNHTFLLRSLHRINPLKHRLNVVQPPHCQGLHQRIQYTAELPKVVIF